MVNLLAELLTSHAPMPLSSLRVIYRSLVAHDCAVSGEIIISTHVGWWGGLDGEYGEVV